MKPIENFENVKATTGEFSKPTAGGYCIEILSANDVPLDATTQKGNYLKIEYDICHGDFAGYYAKQHERFGGNWFASFIRSYKDSASGMFKHFINCIEESNTGYKWSWDEKSLVHKYLGVVLGEEEYRKNDGSIGVRLYVKDVKTVAQILEGDYKVPAIKKIEETASPNKVCAFQEVSADDLPF